MKRFGVWGLALLSLWLLGCSRSQDFARVIRDKNISFVYSDNLSKTRRLLGRDTSVVFLKIPKDERKIFPGSLVILWNEQLQGQNKFLTPIESDPKAYLFEPSGYSVSQILSYLVQYSPLYKVVYTDSVEFFEKNPIAKLKVLPLASQKRDFWEDFLSAQAIVVSFRQRVLGLKPEIRTSEAWIYANPVSWLTPLYNIYIRRLGIKRVYSNNPWLLRRLINADSIGIYPLPTIPTDSVSKVRFERAFRYIQKYLLSGYGIVVYFREPRAEQTNFVSENELKKILKKFPLIDSSLFFTIGLQPELSVFEHYERLSRDFFIKYIYTNNVSLVRHFVHNPNSIIRHLPMKTLNDSVENKKYESQMQSLGSRLNYGRAIVLYFDVGLDFDYPSMEEIKQYSVNCQTIADTGGHLMFTRFLLDKNMVRTLRQLSGKYEFKKILTNNMLLVRAVLGDSLAKVFRTFPKRYDKKRNPSFKQYFGKIRAIRTHLNRGNALIILFDDPLDTLTEPMSKVLKYFDSEMFTIKRTPTAVFVYSYYLDKHVDFYNLVDTNLLLYTNNRDVLHYIYQISYSKLRLMPRRCFPPTCAINTNLEVELGNLRVKIILEQAQLVYFFDRLDSLAPTVKQVKNAYKYLKFESFPKGFVVKNYEGY